MRYAANNYRWQSWTGNNTGGWASTGNKTVQNDQWAQIVIRFEATGDPDASNYSPGVISSYVNGKLVSSTTSGYRSNRQGPFTVGRGGNDGTQYSFSGIIDEVGVWSRALDISEIEANYQMGVD
jgi:hypothetical protein